MAGIKPSVIKKAIEEMKFEKFEKIEKIEKGKYIYISIN